jgi:Holliday junction resolvasome RuvABC endonuclease subunit
MILAFDPGAKRCGWAALDADSGPIYIASGISGLDRTHNGKKALYQEYRLSLIDHWLDEADYLLSRFEPDTVITEIVPVATSRGSNFVLAADSQLVATVVTTIQAVAKLNGIQVKQIAAGKMKRKIGGVKDATKPRVRNGVLSLLPELELRRREFMKVFDETDAIALGLTELGFAV